MKCLSKWGLMSLVAIMLFSCSSEPKRITDEQIEKAVEGKQLLSISASSSGDLEYDYPQNMYLTYVEDGTVYGQMLTPDGLNEPKVQSSRDAEDYFTTDYDTILGENFDFEKMWNNATTYLDEMSNNELENYCIRWLSFETVWKVFSKTLKTKGSITIQATKKGEAASTKLSGRRIETTRNYYEFEFDILDDMQVELKE